MHEDKIAEYRAEAAVCISRANSDSNKLAAARWLKLAADWTRMADGLETKLNPPAPAGPKPGGN